MAVIETDTINTWKAAVTYLKCRTITIVEVNPENIKNWVSSNTFKKKNQLNCSRVLLVFSQASACRQSF